MEWVLVAGPGGEGGAEGEVGADGGVGERETEGIADVAGGGETEGIADVAMGEIKGGREGEGSEGGKTEEDL